jgi:uncharacterized protein YtpQ (UPF0354 family)
MKAEWEAPHSIPAYRLEVPSDDPRIPWVTFGSQGPSGLKPFEVDEIGEVERDELKQAALNHLRERGASWQRVKSQGAGRRSSMLACLDDQLAAERILDVRFVRQAHDKLGTAVLAVGIPRRGLMVAMDGRQPEESLMGFGAFNLAEYHSGESAPITSLTFLMDDGEFAGIANFGQQ